jgi:YHS domain-containing protein
MHGHAAVSTTRKETIMPKSSSVEGQGSKSSSFSQGSTAQQATDPVCGMQVNTQEANVEKAEHNGKTYYFCSSDCREQFEASPHDFEE